MIDLVRSLQSLISKKRFYLVELKDLIREELTVLDEIPGAYKDIDAVMESQKDLVEVVHTLKQIVCIKG